MKHIIFTIMLTLPVLASFGIGKMSMPPDAITLPVREDWEVYSFDYHLPWRSDQ